MSDTSAGGDPPFFPDHLALDQLTLSEGWECARRHPEYIAGWREAAAYWERRREAESKQLPFEEEAPLAVEVLKRFRFFGECPPPSLSAEQLAERSPDFRKAEGAQYARPLHYFSLAQALTRLPPDTKKALGECLASGGDEYAILSLARQDESLQQEVLGVIRYNPGMAVDPIMKNARKVVEAQKEAIGATSTRQKKEGVVAEYFAAWDRREGFADGKYDGRLEQRLADIAKATGAVLATVQFRYESAFRLIFGRDYDYDLYFNVLGHLKADRSRRGGWRMRKRAADGGRSVETVAETDLTSPSASGSFLDSVEGRSDGASEGQQAVEDRLDVQDLARRGWTAEEIALEVFGQVHPPQEVRDMIEWCVKDDRKGRR